MSWLHHRSMAGITDEIPWSITKQVFMEWERLSKTDLSDPLVCKSLREMRIRLEQGQMYEKQERKTLAEEIVQLKQKVSELESTINEQRTAILTQQRVEEIKDQHYEKLHKAYNDLLKKNTN